MSVAGGVGRREIAGVLAAAALIVSAIALYRYFRPGRPEVLPVDLTCSECGKLSQAVVEGMPPFDCPLCGLRAAAWALKCRKCGHIFALRPPEGATEEDIPDPVPCPRCGSENTGAVTRRTMTLDDL